MFPSKLFTFILSCLFLVNCQEAPKEKIDLIILNGTILDLSEQGCSNNDKTGKAILIKGDTIFDIIDAEEISNFEGEIIDAQGKYIIPGLIDGFAAINNQAYANAFLHMGVTDIIGVESERRGPFFSEGNPSPDIHMLREIGENSETDSSIVSTINKHYRNGAEILLMMYELHPDQVKLAHQTAKDLGMGTIGEMGFTSYKEGMEIGADAFVHSTRYSLDIAPDSLAIQVAAHPFSNDLGSPKWRYYQFLAQLEAQDPALQKHANNLGKSNTFILPTFGLLYPEFHFAKNPWNEPIASTIDEKDINRPVNKQTGRHDYPEEELNAYKRMARFQLRTEEQYQLAGANYLSGSASDVWGTMPGISLHQELETLAYIGLSNREVLAASTQNFHDAFGLKFGVIEVGFKANILILDYSPLDDLENLKREKSLVLNGKILILE